LTDCWIAEVLQVADRSGLWEMPLLTGAPRFLGVVGYLLRMPMRRGQPRPSGGRMHSVPVERTFVSIEQAVAEISKSAKSLQLFADQQSLDSTDGQSAG
jgi:hypothetical protein